MRHLDLKETLKVILSASDTEREKITLWAEGFLAGTKTLAIQTQLQTANSVTEKV